VAEATLPLWAKNFVSKHKSSLRSLAAVYLDKFKWAPFGAEVFGLIRRPSVFYPHGREKLKE
jgi:hypothetical protein